LTSKNTRCSTHDNARTLSFSFHPSGSIAGGEALSLKGSMLTTGSPGQRSAALSLTPHGNSKKAPEDREWLDWAKRFKEWYESEEPQGRV
jgi:hypothetical protein